MKVLQVTNLYPYAENPIYGIFVKEQIESLRKVGVHTDVLFINAQQEGKVAYFQAINRIKRESFNYDLIHCHHSYSAYITLALSKVRIPVVTSFLNILGGEGAIPLIERVIHPTVTKGSAALIVKYSTNDRSQNCNKLFYVPNGVDLDMFRPIPKSEAFAKLKIDPGNYLLFVSGGSKLRKQKRYDLFKEVLNILNNEYHLNLKELSMTNVPRKLVPYYFNASALHLLTSDFEGSPNSVKEALACNTPVVSTDVGNIKEMFEGLEGCYVDSTGKPKVLANLVVKALSNTQTIKGQDQIINKRLDMLSTAEKIEKIYNKVLLN